MQARFGLPALLADRTDARRLAVGAAVALGVHALLLLSVAWRPPRAIELVQALRGEPLVQVEAPEPAGGGSPPGAAVPEPAPPTAPRPQPVARKAPARVPVVHAATATEPAATDAVAAAGNAAPSPESLVPIPSNSRAAQQLANRGGRGGFGGNGTGGLFGNGRFAGDGPGALKARVCFIPETTRSLKEIGSCPPIFEQFLDEINVPPRRFEDGFPGLEDRTEYFAVDITGSFSVSEAGSYRFRLKSDDGSQLFIDNRLIVDNDGIHEAIAKRGEADLRAGRHGIRVRFFQAMKYNLALQLFVTPPSGAERLFSSSL
jgi:PA14 domain